MYAFSRAIYRELAGEIVEEPQRAHTYSITNGCCAHARRPWSAWPQTAITSPGQARTLFREIRVYFPMSSQLRVLRVVEHYLAAADDFLSRLPKNGFDINGNALQCRASTRKGSPCQRMPLPHNGYCPSHQHLVETEQLPSRRAA